MRTTKAIGMALLITAALATKVTLAESKNLADYPLRLHIYSRSEVTFYHNRYPDESKGDGRANLFENGAPHGVDFSFDCERKLRNSFGYETYPARWKKPGQELVVLLPVFGEAGHFFTCTLKTDVKSFAYTLHDGSLRQEPVDNYKVWMARHDYDPEHGKDMPAQTTPEPAPPVGGAPAPSNPPDSNKDR